MSLNLSNLTNNPYVQLSQQTVVSNITSAATGAVNNLVHNVQGALGGVGSIASGLADALSSGGMSGGAAAGLMSSKLDTLISGSSSFFAAGSPERITTNALANRNLSASAGSNPETKIPGAKSMTSGAHYVYPPVPAPYYMKLEFAKYARQSPLSNTTLDVIGTVILPMPDGDGLVDNTTANWETQPLGLLGNALDAIADVSSLKNADLGNMVTAQTGDIGMAAGSAIASALGGDNIVDALASATGLAPNPSVSTMFKGVGFRNFTFKWMFAPKEDSESLLIRDIIKFIKSKQLPTFTGSGGTGGTSLFFNYPAIVKPSFSLGQEYMTDFKYCVMKSINVSYAPQGTPAFYSSTKAPVFISLSIELEEMEYRLSEDYNPNAKGDIFISKAAGFGVLAAGAVVGAVALAPGAGLSSVGTAVFGKAAAEVGLASAAGGAVIVGAGALAGAGVGAAVQGSQRNKQQ
jgi:hypothetical protein